MQVILRVRAKCASVLVQVSLMDRSLERKYLSNINTNLFKNEQASDWVIAINILLLVATDAECRLGKRRMERGCVV